MSFHLPYVLTAVGSLKGRVEEENTNSIIPAGAWCLKITKKVSFNIEDSQRLLKTIEDYQRLLKTIEDYRRLSKTIEDYRRLSKTIEDYQRLLKTIEDS